MNYRIAHRTQFSYAAPVRNSFNELRLKPLSNHEQTIEAFELKVTPEVKLNHFHDFYSNVVHHFEIAEPHSSLTIETRFHVNTHPAAPLPETANYWPLARIVEVQKEPRCHEFLEASRFVETSPDAWRLALDATVGQTDVWQAGLAIMRFLHGHLAYETNSTTVHTHMREVLQNRRGVCQDFAHVMLGLCRALKIPALYVSGYLATEKASATHAWVEIFIPQLGWRPLDPTHNRQIDGQYVKIAVGRDYADVPPVTGNYRGTRERSLEVEVKINPA